MTKGKGKKKKIVAGDKWEVNASVPILKLLKSNDRVLLFHMSFKTIQEFETNRIITQFCVGCMSLYFSNQDKTFREQV